MMLNTLPNWLTISRILALPVFLFLAYFPGKGFSIAAALVFSAAAITDLLDGYLARKNEQVSEFGMLIDPIADKILVASAMIMLVHLDRAPGWMIALIISREFAVSGLRAYAGSRNVVLPATFPGKLKTTLQILATIALLVHYPVWGLPFREVGWILLIAAFVSTMWSGYTYFRDYARSVKAETMEQGEG